MNRALTQHLQKMLGRFAEAASKQHPPGLLRIVFMFVCAKKAFDRATQSEERKFWRGYMNKLEASAARHKEELKKRQERTE